MFNRLGDSLANWQQLLTEIRKARSTFDTCDTQKSFGVCLIDYEQVQARMNAKYDAWQSDILSRLESSGKSDEGDACIDFQGAE